MKSKIKVILNVDFKLSGDATNLAHLETYIHVIET